MQAEIITIGDELLIGQVVDTNSAYIAKQLNKIGVSVYQITSIQDDNKHITAALQNAETHADIIILTGGLGPTKDDITKKTITQYFNDTLVQKQSVLQHIEAMWKARGRGKLLQVNIDQALVPSKALVLKNTLGTAPGIWIDRDKAKTIISLPGVPYEMIALLKHEVIPRLKEKYQRPFILHKTLLVSGLGESALAHRIAHWENALPPNVKLAYLPSSGKIRLRISSKGANQKVVTNQVDSQIKTLLPLIKNEFLGFQEGQGSLETIIAKQLTQLKQTLAVAESCTGGKLAEQFTAHSGASAYFKGGVVTYSTASKINILKVAQSDIEAFSVVSQQVAEAMAKHAKKIFQSDYAIATTGNAGPEKGDSNAEVGTVYIAIATPTTVYSEKFMLGNQRASVINKAVNSALGLLLKEILKNR